MEKWNFPIFAPSSKNFFWVFFSESHNGHCSHVLTDHDIEHFI